MPNTIPALKEPKTRRNTSRKLVILLMVLFLALLAILFFRSSLSKISEIHFEGSVYSTQAELLQKSGLKEGMSFFGTSAATIRGRLTTVPSIQSVTVDKRFPGVVDVTIKEYPPVAYELNPDGKLLAYLSNGTKVTVKSGISVEKPMLSGWEGKEAILLKLCSVLSKISDDLTSDISEIVPTPTLSFPDRIRLYTRSGFEVVTTISLIQDKVAYLNDIIETQEPGLITLLEADTYVPFSSGDVDKEGEKGTTHE